MAKKMEDQKFYMTITAVVAIVAVVGLIMMFGLKKPLGEEVVGHGGEVLEGEGTEEKTEPAPEGEETERPDIGSTVIADDEEGLFVEIPESESSDDWTLGDTHVHVGVDETDYPREDLEDIQP